MINMLRIKVTPQFADADYVAVPSRSPRFILPGRYLFALTLVCAGTGLFMLPDSSAPNLEYAAMEAERAAFLTAEQKEIEITPADQNLENYEDYDIPIAQFKAPLPVKELSPRSAAVYSFDRQLAPAELLEIQKSAEALRQAQNAAQVTVPAAPEGAAAAPQPAVIASNPGNSAESYALERPEGQWYQYTVLSGDSLSGIFSLLALPQGTLQKLAAAASAKDLALHPGQILHFYVTTDGALTELVVPAVKGDGQIRLVRQNQDAQFALVHEDKAAHLSTPAEAKALAQADAMPSAKAAAKARLAREEARLMAAKAAAQERDRSSPADPLRPRLIYGALKPGENFKSCARRLGLTSTEVRSLERIYASKGSLKKLKPGDSVRVLFNEIGTSALINAVEINSAAFGRTAYYRSTADNNFYEEDKYVPTAGIFRRFPLATAIKINSKFNLHRRHPVTGRVSPHKGIDIKAPIGTPVYAPADGMVTFAGYQRAAGYYIILRHEQNYSTVYMHLSRIDVKKGQQIMAGQVIAKTGNTGRTTGPHLHYELRINDRPVDPLKIELPTSSHPNLAREQREAFKSSVQVFKTQLFNEALAQNQ